MSAFLDNPCRTLSILYWAYFHEDLQVSLQMASGLGAWKTNNPEAGKAQLRCRLCLMRHIKATLWIIQGAEAASSEASWGAV